MHTSTQVDEYTSTQQYARNKQQVAISKTLENKQQVAISNSHESRHKKQETIIMQFGFLLT